jgi:hypothetical protein
MHCAPGKFPANLIVLRSIVVKRLSYEDLY